jgi:predicted DNA-binding protein (MmcQ/YjbR family)
MNIESLREYCLSKPDVEEGLPFGPDTLVFKSKGKIFLLTGFEEPLKINVKCDPEQAILLRETYEAVLPGYHMNKMHWNTVILDGSIPQKTILSFIDQSYELVGAKAKKKSKK